jgi:hypothetical protein
LLFEVKAMKINTIKILFILFLITPLYGFSPNSNPDVDKWLYVVSSDEYNFYYDFTNINNSLISNYTTVWVKAVPRYKQEWEGKEISYVLKQWVFYAGSRQFKEAQTIFYFDKNYELHYGTEKKAVKPGTVAEKFYDKFCSR